MALSLLLSIPTSADALGYELSAGGNLGRGQGAALQTGALLDFSLAADPQILIGVRAEAGSRLNDASWSPLYRAALAGHWRFDRSRWMFRLGAHGGAEIGAAEGVGFYAGAELGLDYWRTPHQGMAYGITLGYELDLQTGAERIVFGLRLRVGGERLSR